jgi:hypothetical protein
MPFRNASAQGSPEIHFDEGSLKSAATPFPDYDLAEELLLTTHGFSRICTDRAPKLLPCERSRMNQDFFECAGRMPLRLEL